MTPAKETTVINIAVPESGEGVRLDVFLSGSLHEEYSRSRLQKLISEGNVLLNGSVERPATKLRTGDVIEISVPPPEAWDVLPEDIPLEVVYEDRDILVINKPRGMVVHPGAGNWEGTLVNAVLAHVPDLKGIGGEIRPGIVHRLDKDTTGLLVVAKTEPALRSLQKQIKDRKMRRSYLALVRGALRPLEGAVDAPIGRHPVNRKKMAVLAQGGRTASTHYKVIAVFGDDYSLVQAELVTGRTHQIRVHFAHLGHSVAGDSVYGRTEAGLGLQGQALHAYLLGLYRPLDEEYVEFRAPLPHDFQNALLSLRTRFKEELPEWLT